MYEQVADSKDSSQLIVKISKCMFHMICGLTTVIFTSYCIYQYLLDEDISRIDFKKFNSNENHIYPAITLCFSYPLLAEKLTRYGEGIDVSSYTSFMEGNLWDDRMANIDFDDVSINFEDYLLGKLCNKMFMIHNSYTKYKITN